MSSEPKAVQIECGDRVIRVRWGDLPRIVRAHLKVLAARSRVDGRKVGENGEGRGLVEFTPPDVEVTYVGAQSPTG